MGTENTLIRAGDFSHKMEDAIKLFERGYNLYEVCVKLEVPREAFAEWVKADDRRMQRITEARRQGADCLVSTYKDLLMREYKTCDDQRDRISILREMGNHIRWEASAVHNGSYSAKSTVELKGKLEYDVVPLTDSQIRDMAREVLSQPGDSLVKH